MMKARTILTAASLSLILVACGEEDETVEEPASADDTGQTEDQPESESEIQEDTGISLLTFEMDAKYEGNNNDFEVSFDNEASQVEASYENEKDMLTMSGDDAFKEIQPVLSEFDFTIETPDDEVIDSVIKGFEVEEGFQSIEIEITFEDGTEKEYQRGE